MPPLLEPPFARSGTRSSLITVISSIQDWFIGAAHAVVAAAFWVAQLPGRLLHAILAGVEAAGQWIAHALWLILMYLLVAAAVVAVSVCLGSLLYLIAMRTLNYRGPRESRRQLPAGQRWWRHAPLDDHLRGESAHAPYGYQDQRSENQHSEQADHGFGNANRQTNGSSPSSRPSREQRGYQGGTERNRPKAEGRDHNERQERERAEEESRSRQRKEQQARREAAAKVFAQREAAKKYAVWKENCDKFFASKTGDIPEPPYWPCSEPSCQSPRLLKACRHSFEKLFGSGDRLQEVLKEELRRWHPDWALFRRLGERHVAVAEEITKTIGSLRSG